MWEVQYGFEQQLVALVLGTTVAWIAEGICYGVSCMGKTTNPQAVLRRFYFAHCLKWIFVMMLLSFLFKYKNLPTALILTGFIAMKLFLVFITLFFSLRQKTPLKKRALS